VLTGEVGALATKCVTLVVLSKVTFAGGLALHW
jgi:hypothetical protein